LCNTLKKSTNESDLHAESDHEESATTPKSGYEILDDAKGIIQELEMLGIKPPAIMRSLLYTYKDIIFQSPRFNIAHTHRHIVLLNW